MADRSAAGLHRRAVLGADRPAMAARQAADADRRGRLAADRRPGHDGAGLARVQPTAPSELRSASRWTSWPGSGTTPKARAYLRSAADTSPAFLRARRPGGIRGRPPRPDGLRRARARATSSARATGGMRDDVRYLPAADREDLELWLMERAYRYCRALEDRPDSPVDWEQALKILDRVGGPDADPAFAPLRDRLLAKLGAGHPPAPSRSSSAPAPPGSTSTCSASWPSASPKPPSAPPPGPAEVTEALQGRGPQATPRGRAGAAPLRECWPSAPTPSGGIIARRPSASAWAGSPRPPITWRGAWSAGPTMPRSAGSSPAA